MKNIFFLIVFIALIILSCSSSNFKKDKSGLEYILFPNNQNNTEKLKIGDLIQMSLSYETENGVELFNSNSSNRKYLRKLGEATHSGGSFEDGLLLMSLGDSAVFRILADNFLLKSENFNTFPTDVKLGDMIIVKVKIIDILNKDDAEKIVSNKYHESEDVELKLLHRYLKNSNIDTTPNTSGVYIQKLESGNGEIVKSASIVSIDFMLTLIDGTLVETSYGKQAFIFKIDADEVIKGLNDGLKGLKEGDSIKLIVPSKLAYGKQGSGKIQSFSTLVFNIEIIKVK